MDSVPFSFAANVVGIVTGGLSLLGLFLAFYRGHLPNSRYQSLEALLKETEHIHTSALERNLLPLRYFREQSRARLDDLRDEMYAHRRRAYGATSLVQQYRELLRGLTLDIDGTCSRVRDIRAAIVIASEAERLRLRNLHLFRSATEPSPTYAGAPTTHVPNAIEVHGGSGGVPQLAETDITHTYPPSYSPFPEEQALADVDPRPLATGISSLSSEPLEITSPLNANQAAELRRRRADRTTFASDRVHLHSTMRHNSLAKPLSDEEGGLLELEDEVLLKKHITQGESGGVDGRFFFLMKPYQGFRLIPLRD